jgi:hypothetical protein
VGRAVWVDSQATSKGARGEEETRERAERVSVVSGSDQATVVAEEDTHTARPAQRTERGNRDPDTR